MEKTFAEEIEEAADGEILAVVISDDGWLGYSKKAPDGIANTVQPWERVRFILDYIYDRGFGAPDCHAIYAWSADRIVFVSTYDGSTGVEWIPRNPVDIEAQMFGGG